MTHERIRAAWSFECVLPTGVKIKSWFYSDSEADVVKRITEYLGARLIKIKPIDNPLQDITKKTVEKDSIKSNPLFKSL
jgi:hypothetical protein